VLPLVALELVMVGLQRFFCVQLPVVVLLVEIKVEYALENASFHLDYPPAQAQHWPVHLHYPQ
jgi:hypothetical protein